jgi:hypothetical protein
MTTLTLTIERTPRTLHFGGAALAVEELGVRLPFSRKPVDLSEVGGSGPTTIYITHTHTLTPLEFDAFARDLLRPRPWLVGKGGSVENGMLCVEVTAPGRPYLYVNPEGGNVARYVARLGRAPAKSGRKAAENAWLPPGTARYWGCHTPPTTRRRKP